jgi:hypothetical protein
MPAARFQKIPSSAKMTHTPFKGFPTAKQAMKAIETVLKSMPLTVEDVA